MIDFQLKQTAFQFGLAEGTDPHAVPFGVLSTLENFVWTKSSCVRKRLGVTILPDTVPSAKRIFSRGSELCVIDGTHLHSYDPISETFRSVAKVPNIGITWDTLLDPSQGVASSDTAVSSEGLLVHAWTTGDPTVAAPAGYAWVRVLNATTGAEVMAATRVSTAALANFGIRVLISGTTAVVITREGTGTPTLRACRVDLTALTVSTTNVLVSDCATAGGFNGWDAFAIGTNFVIAYNRTGPLLALESFTFAAFTPVASGSVVDASGCSMVSIDGTAGESLYVLYCQATATPRAVRLAVNHPTTLAAVVAPVTLETPPAGYSETSVGVCRYDATNCIILYRTFDGALSGRMNTAKVSNAGVVSASTWRGAWGSVPTSRPFMIGSKCYATVIDTASWASAVSFTVNSSLVEIETSHNGSGSFTQYPNRYVSKIEATVAGTQPTAAPLPSVSSYGGTHFLNAPYQGDAVQASSNWRQGVRLLRLSETVPTDFWRSITRSGETYIMGGGLSVYDSHEVFDYGFGRPPSIAVLLNSGVGSLVTGTYIYTIVQEFRSHAGILHRSPPAIARSRSTTGPSANTMAVTGYNLQKKITPFTSTPTLINLVVFRTVVDGTIPQRLSFEPGYTTVNADMSAVSATIVDIHADADITSGAGPLVTLASRPAVYTQGGILPDEQPPAGVGMFEHADRLFHLMGDRRTYWYSKTFSDDLGVAPGFSPALRIVFPAEQVGGGSMDEKGIFFGTSGISYTLGRGPTPNGLGSEIEFTNPIKIQTDVGCVNARSIVSMPDGYMFEGQRGIYILTRGLELVWVGRPVQDTLELFPTITSAVLVAKKNEVRFTCIDEAETAGVVLVYNYVEKQWSTAKYAQVEGVGVPIVDATMHNDAWTFVTAAGAVYQETEGVYLDNEVYVPGVIESAWISAAGPVAFQVVRDFWLAGASHSRHILTVEAAFNSSASYQQERIFNNRPSITNVSPLEECQLQIGKRRKCNSIRFRVSDSAPLEETDLGTGQGPSWETMGFSFGIMKGSTMPAHKKG